MLDRLVAGGQEPLDHLDPLLDLDQDHLDMDLLDRLVQEQYHLVDGGQDQLDHLATLLDLDRRDMQDQPEILDHRVAGGQDYLLGQDHLGQDHLAIQDHLVDGGHRLDLDHLTTPLDQGLGHLDIWDRLGHLVAGGQDPLEYLVGRGHLLDHLATPLDRVPLDRVRLDMQDHLDMDLLDHLDMLDHLVAGEQDRLLGQDHLTTALDHLVPLDLLVLLDLRDLLDHRVAGEQDRLLERDHLITALDHLVPLDHLVAGGHLLDLLVTLLVILDP